MPTLNPVILGFLVLLIAVTVVLFVSQRNRGQKSITPGTAAPTQRLASEPEQLTARVERLKSRFGFTPGAISNGIRAVFAGSDASAQWDELEDALIMADLGVKATGEVIEQLKLAATNTDFQDAELLERTAREVLVGLVDGGYDRSLNLARVDNQPAVILTVGVNGTGKTTTTGKLARLLVAEGKDVLLGAADTFRAAAADQLETWGSRVGVPVVRGTEGADPASVAFTAVSEGVTQEVDVVLIDTAGRLHTKTGLMDELGKLYRVVSKSRPVAEVLLVIDATTGQNGLLQAKVFSEVVPVTGIVLTKLDGTAKGGIVLAVQQELGVPVKFVGLGEGVDDLAPFDPTDFVAGLLS
jgi:fused signal recognition particle receptor